MRLIVPFAPGSTPDLLARMLAEPLTGRFGQAFFVDNRPGAGGNIGTRQVARSAPDGYSIGVSITGPLVNNLLLYPKLGYDPFKDLTPITLAAIQPSVLVVSPVLGVTDVASLLDLLRRSPGRFNYASIGAGSVSQLSMELIEVHTGTRIVHVPYDSSAAAVASLLSGDTQIASLAPAAVMPQVRAGTLRALAVTSAQRFEPLPQLPTFRECGIPDVVATAWIGIVAPARLPAALIQRIHSAFADVLHDEAVMGRLRAQYMQPVGDTPAQFAAFMKEEYERWAPVIRKSGIRLE